MEPKGYFGFTLAMENCPVSELTRTRAYSEILGMSDTFKAHSVREDEVIFFSNSARECSDLTLSIKKSGLVCLYRDFFPLRTSYHFMERLYSALRGIQSLELPQQEFKYFDIREAFEIEITPRAIPRVLSDLFGVSGFPNLASPTPSDGVALEVSIRRETGEEEVHVSEIAVNRDPLKLNWVSGYAWFNLSIFEQDSFSNVTSRLMSGYRDGIIHQGNRDVAERFRKYTEDTENDEQS